jgi:hypothetical protein
MNENIKSLKRIIEAQQQEIQQLQAENAAAIDDIKHALVVNGGCPICKHWNKADPLLPWCKIAKVSAQANCFEWRGVSTTYHNPADMETIEQLKAQYELMLKAISPLIKLAVLVGNEKHKKGEHKGALVAEMYVSNARAVITAIEKVGGGK